MLLRLLAIVSLVAALSAGVDKGGGIDPNGGGAMDPNGALLDDGPGIDPDGAQVCYSACVDPNG